MFAALFAKLGLNLLWGKAVANAKHDWAAIPRKVKLAIAAIAAIVVLFFVHQHYAHKALKAADLAGYQRAKAEDRAAALELAKHARATETVGRQVTQKVEADHAK